MHLQKTKGFFVTGTDTEVGKTTVTRLLINSLNKQGYQTIGCKPISCGVDGDECIYQTINPIALDSDLVNPFHFNLAVSPNIAAKNASQTLSAKQIHSKIKKLLNLPLDCIFYEGTGGWKTPISDHETMADVAKELNLPVILVIGIRVGCLNHALLTAEAMMKDELPMAGWIANIIDETTPQIESHLNTLQNWLTIPFLGQVDYSRAEEITTSINFQQLLFSTYT